MERDADKKAGSGAPSSSGTKPARASKNPGKSAASDKGSAPARRAVRVTDSSGKAVSSDPSGRPRKATASGRPPVAPTMARVSAPSEPIVSSPTVAPPAPQARRVSPAAPRREAPVVSTPAAAPRTAAAPRQRVASSTSDSDAASQDQPSIGTERYPRLGNRNRFRARRVRRLVRHVDPWSIFKLTLLLNVCMWIIVVVAGLTMWSVARNAGTIDNLEEFVANSFGLPDFSVDATVIFQIFALTGLTLSLALTGAAVIGTILFNLISDLIGGIWVSVIEEETAETSPSS